MSEAGAAAVTLARAAPEARRRHALGRLAGRNRLAIVGALALLLAVSAALLAPWLPLADPDAVDTPNRLRPPLNVAGAAMRWEAADRTEDHYPESACSCGGNLAGAVDLRKQRAFRSKQGVVRLP